MADRPRYQRANLVYADMPNIQPVDLQEQLNANKRIGAALDQMTSITTDIGKKYAVDPAIAGAAAKKLILCSSVNCYFIFHT